MNFFRKKWQITLIIVAAIAMSGFILEHFIGVNPIKVTIKTVITPIKSGFSYIAHSLEEVRNFVWDMRAYREDNERLEAENLALRQQNRDVAVYREENERLQALLDLQESLSEYQTVAARVISYSGNNWYELVEINKGTLNGLKEGDAVVTPDGLVGKITEAGPNYSMVTTMLDVNAAVGIKVSRTGGNGLVEGDAELAKNMQCKLSFVDRSTPIIVGDVVETSGTGGTYPPGFLVGSIINVSADSTGNLKFAVIDPAVDFDTLNEVLVIKW